MLKEYTGKMSAWIMIILLMNEKIREVLNSKDFYDYYEKYVIPVLKNAQGQCNDNNIDDLSEKK